MSCTCVPFELSKWALPWNLKIKVSGSLVLVFTQTRLHNPHSRMSNWFWVTTGVKWLYKIAFELVNTGLWAFEQDKEESWQELIKMKKGKDICESPMPMVRGKWVLVKRGKRVMAWQWVGSKQGLCPSPCPIVHVHVQAHVHRPSKGERRWWLGSVGSKQAGSMSSWPAVTSSPMSWEVLSFKKHTTVRKAHSISFVPTCFLIFPPTILSHYFSLGWSILWTGWKSIVRVRMQHGEVAAASVLFLAEKLVPLQQLISPDHHPPPPWPTHH